MLDFPRKITQIDIIGNSYLVFQDIKSCYNVPNARGIKSVKTTLENYFK